MIYFIAIALIALSFAVGLLVGYRLRKPGLCDTCKHLESKCNGSYMNRYKCDFDPLSFDKAPEYCKKYKQREDEQCQRT